MQSVLITGGTDFIGQNQAWRAAARPDGRRVVVVAMIYAANDKAWIDKNYGFRSAV